MHLRIMYMHLSSILIIMLLITAENILTVRNGGKLKNIKAAGLQSISDMYPNTGHPVLGVFL